MARGLEKWVGKAPQLESSLESLKTTYQRSIVDLAALRFSPALAAGDTLPAAGLPWFMTMFGRDSIFTSLQALPFTPELAATTLRVLGAWQGSRVDDFRDEDPGRILHEMRYGEMTAFEERPHSPYYGNADATPLYVVLMDEYERWTGDSKLVRDFEPQARAALNWIERVRRPAGQRLRLLQAPERGDRSGEPVLEGLLGLGLLSRRNAAGLSPGHLRAAGLCLRCQGSRRPACPPFLARPGVRRQAREGGGRPQAALQPRLLGQGPRVLRHSPRRRWPAGRLPDVEHRPSPVERHRREVQGEDHRPAPHERAAVLRLGGADPGRRRRPLQPDRLPRGHSLAVRQLLHRVGPAEIRLQGRSCARRRGHPGRGAVLRRVPARGLRRVPAADDQVSRPVPDGLQPAGVVNRGAAPAASRRPRHVVARR